MKYHCILISLSIFIQGCTSNMFQNDRYASRFSQFGYGFDPKQTTETENAVSPVSLKILKKYADSIAMSLSEQVDIDAISQIGVATFVDLDDNLQSSHALGNKLAETLIISLHEVGFNMAELNLSRHVETSDKGNFIFNRVKQTQKKYPFMVSGIINYTQSGVNINSRLIQSSSADILAVNSLFMPHFILKNTFPDVEGTDLIIKAN